VEDSTNLRHSAKTGAPAVTVKPKAVAMLSLDRWAMIALLMGKLLNWQIGHKKSPGG
jgi:hypothetical protein